VRYHPDVASKSIGLSPLLLLILFFPASNVVGQTVPFDRLPPTQLDVVPPSARVVGLPGTMTLRQAPCRMLPTAGVRRRLVDLAVQEWAFFGFSVFDQTDVDEERDPNDDPGPRRRRRVDPTEAARVASSIAGYWATTPEGSWIVGRQNEAWTDADGLSARWRYPWSAAFISWVMCEGGLGSTAAFRRAVAHHTYIDQAIRSRDGGEPGAFVAYDAGEVAVEPGDLLCSARRPAYRSLAERRRQLGTGARTHCDIVVKVDEGSGRILAIGGNVRGSVGLKLLPFAAPRGPARFAHLKLRAPSIGPDALDTAPTITALGCAGQRAPSPIIAVGDLIPRPVTC
jgi:hypothetical protein